MIAREQSERARSLAIQSDEDAALLAGLVKYGSSIRHSEFDDLGENRGRKEADGESGGEQMAHALDFPLDSVVPTCPAMADH
ncbi:hypothetical protein [Agrobacterium rubi]|uniref:hypothetical protein n=1 Tax=Agrobacterium rubi TaxID=28099 RepID=UPI00201B54A1|nr:hypothetical protein [Agrobacterium rubi]